MSHHINIVRIQGVYYALGELRDSVAFVGGATVSLYADNPAQSVVRPTDDIDVLIEIGSYSEYVKVQEKLAELRFEIDATSKVTCRYKYQGLTVDVMPTDESVLGFSNKWYKAGFASLVQYRIDERTAVNIFSAPYFIATKLEAFRGRGKGDGRTSQDFEDIVFVLENRTSIWAEIDKADTELRNYLTAEIHELLGHPYLEEWLSVHLEYETASARAVIIIEAMNNFVNQ